MSQASGSSSLRHALGGVFGSSICLLGLLLVPRVAEAQSVSPRSLRSTEGAAGDGVYGRFDGDLDLGFALGAEFGSAGHAAPSLRATAHYFSIGGVYANGRIKAGDESAPSLFGIGVDLRPLFVPRWAKNLETGSPLFDLTLDSLSLSLGAFWAHRDAHAPNPYRGFDAQFGLGIPLLATAAGPWLEVRGALRYPDGANHEEAVLLLLSWHGFVTTPFSHDSSL